MFKSDMYFGIFFLKTLLLLFRLKNILFMLFAFEFIMVNLMFSFVYLSVPFDPMSMLVLLAVAAGEASLGLSLLMSVLRQMGNDKMFIFSHSGFEG